MVGMAGFVIRVPARARMIFMGHSALVTSRRTTARGMGYRTSDTLLSQNKMVDGKPQWLQSKVQGVLLDISGVLYNSGKDGGSVIEGSVEAVERLKAAGVGVRFCTNETQSTRVNLVEKLNNFGFKLTPKEIFAPPLATKMILEKRKLRPHLLIHPGGRADFDGLDFDNPNCVVIGDATDQFNYENLNKAFRTLLEMEEPILFSMGYGKFYKRDGQLVLNVGTFTKAIEYACDVKAEIVGKPSKVFFLTPLEDMGVSTNEAVMIGDDIANDVGGAQACGMRGVQVKTGKFRPSDENHPTVKADGLVENLAHAVDLIIKYNQP